MRLDDAPDLLKVSEAAAILRVGRNAVYEMVTSGELASLRIGGRIRIPRWVVAEFIGLPAPKHAAHHHRHLHLVPWERSA